MLMLGDLLTSLSTKKLPLATKGTRASTIFTVLAIGILVEDGRLILTSPSVSVDMASSNERCHDARGKLLFGKNQTINWNFAILSKVIERLAGVSYGTFIHDKILLPLLMERPSASYGFANGNLAPSYAILDNLPAYELLMPKSEDVTIMAFVQGIQRVANDLLKYSRALMSAYHSQLQNKSTSSPGPPLKHVGKQLTAHTPRGSPSMLQRHAA
ncbi:MAG: hypothetical protein M1829_000677 [Trizodia sp. TS-e1964]|nr:MAG: hypothetical protein M1829_000677 [Trizodia sp. TS-e1964]